MANSIVSIPKTKSSIDIYLVLLILFLLIVCYYKYSENKIETWLNYQVNPFGNYYTGSDDPVALYPKPIYRAPYMYPACRMINYPVPHCQTLSD